MNLGICMAGLEDEFEKALARMPAGNPIVPFRYVEIGVAYCQTFAAVVEWLRANSSEWRAAAIDPSELAKDHFERLGYEQEANVVWFNLSREEAFIGWSSPIHFCLIDGCHSRKCVMEDFQSVEPWMTPGGLVVFHDFEPERVGTDVQPHCGMTQDVRGAVEELGLLDGSRPGWRRLPDWKGDRTKDGADCGVFERATI